jgi:hypothetical protein
LDRNDGREQLFIRVYRVYLRELYAPDPSLIEIEGVTILSGDQLPTTARTRSVLSHRNIDFLTAHAPDVCSDVETPLADSACQSSAQFDFRRYGRR